MDEENETMKKFARSALMSWKTKQGCYPSEHWAWSLLGMCAEIDHLRDLKNPNPHIEQLRDEMSARMIGTEE